MSKEERSKAGSFGATHPCVILALALLGTGACAEAPEPPENPEPPPPATIVGTQVHTLSSMVRGRDYRITVALPYSYEATDGQYPVIYMLDADFGFGLGTDLARMLAFGAEAQEAILVGVGYGDISVEEWGWLRSVDLTPSADARFEETAREMNPDAPEVLSGEAAAFLRFLREEVRPFVESRYRTAEDGIGLFGDSLGGLFALYTLFHAPDTFDRYIVGSPSIWWGEKITMRFEEEYAAGHTDLRAEVFMSVGLLEEDPEIPQSAASAMVTNLQEMAGRLDARGYPGLDLTTHFFDGETHLSVIPLNLSWGLRTLYPAR